MSDTKRAPRIPGDVLFPCGLLCVLTQIILLEASTNSQPQDPNVTFLKNVGESVAAFLSPLGKWLTVCHPHP